VAVCPLRPSTILIYTTMPARKPFNLQKWIDENRHHLKPPVGNKNLYPEGTDYIVMIVAGPNARKDYHYNETEELFYQLEGDINVRIQEDGKAVDVPISAGEMFLLPCAAKAPLASSLSVCGKAPTTKTACSGFVTAATTSCTKSIFPCAILRRIFFPISGIFMEVKNCGLVAIVAQ